MSKLLDYAALQERGIRYSKAHLWRLWTAGKLPSSLLKNLEIGALLVFFALGFWGGRDVVSGR